MAVQRKTILVYALLSMLIASMIGTSLAGSAKANFQINYPPATTDKPVITFLPPPKNSTAPITVVVFTVTMPKPPG